MLNETKETENNKATARRKIQMLLYFFPYDFLFVLCWRFRFWAFLWEFGDWNEEKSEGERYLAELYRNARRVSLINIM